MGGNASWVKHVHRRAFAGRGQSLRHAAAAGRKLHSILGCQQRRGRRETCALICGPPLAAKL